MDSFERHVWSGGLHTFLYGSVESINIRCMFLLRFAIHGYAEISHFCTESIRLAISMYVCAYEATLQVYLVYLFNFIFSVLYFPVIIILPVASLMCQYMMFSNTMPLICTRSHHRVTFLYFSIMSLGTIGTITGSTCWILYWTIFPWKCGTLVPCMCSAIPTSYRRIGRFWKILLSNACRIRFICWPVSFCNFFAQSALFTSWETYCFFFYSAFGMGKSESFTMMCKLLFLRRCLILW